MHVLSSPVYVKIISKHCSSYGSDGVAPPTLTVEKIVSYSLLLALRIVMLEEVPVFL